MCVRACLQSLYCIVNLHVYARMHAPRRGQRLFVLFFVPFVPLAVYGILGIYVCFVYTYGWKSGSLSVSVWIFFIVLVCILYSVCCILICGRGAGGCCCILVSRPLGDVGALEPDVGGRRFFLYCIVAGRIRG